MANDIHNTQKIDKKANFSIKEALPTGNVENTYTSEGVNIILVNDLRHDALYIADKKTVFINAALEPQKKAEILRVFHK